MDVLSLQESNGGDSRDALDWSSRVTALGWLAMLTMLTAHRAHPRCALRRYDE